MALERLEVYEREITRVQRAGKTRVRARGSGSGAGQLPAWAAACCVPAASSAPAR